MYPVHCVQHIGWPVVMLASQNVVCSLLQFSECNGVTVGIFL